VIAVSLKTDNEELLLITESGNNVRLNVSEVSVSGRNTQGVRLVVVAQDNQVVSVEKLVE